MRLNVTFDQDPEFESFAAMVALVRGAAWSLTNTELSDVLPTWVRDDVVGMLHTIDATLASYARDEAQCGVGVQARFAVVHSFSITA